MNARDREQRREARELAQELAELQSNPNVRILDRLPHGLIVRTFPTGKPIPPWDSMD